MTPVNRWLWTGVFVAPAAWIVAFELNYTLVPFTCQSGQKWVLHAISASAFALAAFGAAAARMAWLSAGREVPGEGATPEARTRFLGMFGMGFSAVMMLLIVAQWLPVLFLDPCTIG